MLRPHKCAPPSPTVAGVRNTVGFDWDPRTQVLYFGFLERDWQVGNRGGVLVVAAVLGTGAGIAAAALHWITALLSGCKPVSYCLVRAAAVRCRHRLTAAAVTAPLPCTVAALQGAANSTSAGYSC